MSEGAGASPRVLVVDDDPAVRQMLQIWLARQGCTPLLACNGSEAVNLYRAHPGIALVLIDVQMPGWDGPATLAALRQLDPYVRCAFMAGDSGRYTADKLLGFGALDVLGKPFRWQSLEDVLRRAGAEPDDPHDPS